MENLRVYLLGTFRLYRDGVLLTSKDWQIRHARQLFQLLFTERGHTVPADRVIDLLWPYSAEHAHKTLRSAVSILRSVLEPAREPQAPSRFVPRGSTGYTLQLPDDDSVWIDTIEFERLLGEAHGGHAISKRRRILESALQLYIGDYLADEGQEGWAIAERTRLREQYFTNVLALMELQRNLGFYNEAIAVGRKALTIDVCREPLYPIIMHCQAMQGDTVGALQTFEQCRQELGNQLGVDPSPQTLTLHTKLLQGEFRPTSTSSSQMVVKHRTRFSPRNQSVSVLAPVHYKDAPKRLAQEPFLVTTQKEHLSWLTQQLRFLKEERTRVRGPRIIACLGEMGVGKSFLLHNILNYAQKLPLITLTTACHVLEQGVAFAPFIAMMKAWLGELRNEELNTFPRPTLATLAHVMPELLTSVPALAPTVFLSVKHMRNALITAFVDVISVLSMRRPLMIMIDDLQWTDEASLIVLYRLAHLVISTGGEGRSLLVMLAYRPEDVLGNEPLKTMLHSLGQNPLFHALHLARFSLGEVETYVNVHDATHALSVDQLYQATQGNALLLTEAVRILQDQQERYADVQELHKNNAMDALLHSYHTRDMVLARIARLPQRAIELLEYASVIRHPFPPDLLSPCLCVEEYNALDALLAGQFLCEQEGKEHDVSLTFVHEVVAQIVYNHCSVVKRAQLHRYMAEQLIRYYANTTYTHASEIASHYRCAGPLYQMQALHYEVQVEDHLMHVTKENCNAY